MLCFPYLRARSGIAPGLCAELHPSYSDTSRVLLASQYVSGLYGYHIATRAEFERIASSCELGNWFSIAEECKPTRFYVDLERKSEAGGPGAVVDAGLAQRLLEECLRITYGDDSLRFGYAAYDGSRRGKVSAHLYGGTKAFADVKELGFAMFAAKALLEARVATGCRDSRRIVDFVDWGVYTNFRAFRMPFCYKIDRDGSTSPPFLPIEATWSQTPSGKIAGHVMASDDEDVLPRLAYRIQHAPSVNGRPSATSPDSGGPSTDDMWDAVRRFSDTRSPPEGSIPDGMNISASGAAYLNLSGYFECPVHRRTHNAKLFKVQLRVACDPDCRLRLSWCCASSLPSHPDALPDVSAPLATRHLTPAHTNLMENEDPVDEGDADLTTERRAAAFRVFELLCVATGQSECLRSGRATFPPIGENADGCDDLAASVLHSVSVDGARTVFAEAPTGSGKTRAALKLIRWFSERGKPCAYVGIYVVPLREASDRYGNAPKIENFGRISSIGPPRVEPGVAVFSTINSLHRLVDRASEFSLVVIDECETALMTVASSIITTENQISAKLAIQRMMRSASTVVALGTEMSDDVRRFIEAYRPPDQFRVASLHGKRYAAFSITGHPPTAEMSFLPSMDRHTLLDGIVNGDVRSAMILCSRKNRPFGAIPFAESLRKAGLDGETDVVTGDNSATVVRRATPRFLIATSAIAYGVSYHARSFDSTVLFADHHTTNAETCAQMLGRNRLRSSATSLRVAVLGASIDRSSQDPPMACDIIRRDGSVAFDRSDPFSRFYQDVSERKLREDIDFVGALCRRLRVDGCAVRYDIDVAFISARLVARVLTAAGFGLAADRVTWTVAVQTGTHAGANVSDVGDRFQRSSDRRIVDALFGIRYQSVARGRLRFVNFALKVAGAAGFGVRKNPRRRLPGGGRNDWIREFVAKN